MSLHAGLHVERAGAVKPAAARPTLPQTPRRGKRRRHAPASSGLPPGGTLDRVRFRDASGQSFGRYEGAWRLARLDGQTVISYELSAKPSFAVPGFLLMRLLKRDAKEMIERLKTEIEARTQLAW